VNGCQLDRNDPVLYKDALGECMVQLKYIFVCAVASLLLTVAATGQANDNADLGRTDKLLIELESSEATNLEDLVQKGSSRQPQEGFASYYAKRFEGRRTTSGQRYHPDKMTAAHHSLPLGTVVRVVNPSTSQEVHVTVNDRCSRKPFPFIDLSRAAAKKISLWGKGRIRVVIIPILEDKLEDPA
jgi:rare lipoprotein A